jgi:6-hydroxycyclohex-1-ene-1-carbonyl-CoA dehydrogenase
MSLEGYRWLMTAVNAPLERAAFRADPGPGEVVVDIAGCGVCHTDLGYLYDGVRTNHPLPLALGHEISGRVVEAGAGAEGWKGKAAIVPAVLPCGECDLCQRGLGTICRQQKMPGNDIQGGFGSHIVVPSRGLCEVDEARLASAGLALADVSIVADALTTPYQAVRRAGVKPGSLPSLVRAARRLLCPDRHAFGAKVVAIDVDDDKPPPCHATAALTINSRAQDARRSQPSPTRENGLRATEWCIFEYPVPPAS